MDSILTTIANKVRTFMLLPARALHNATGGRLTPNHVTLVSLLGHFWVMYELYQSRPLRAAIWLVFFGLMDSLDGALARTQGSGSPVGILYDSVSDRVKEVILYVGIAMFFFTSSALAPAINVSISRFYYERNLPPAEVWLPVAVCGLSIIVSYIRARGETILQAYKPISQKQSRIQTNKVFTDGIARYEVRMALIVLGLITGTLLMEMHILLSLLVVTALQRILQVSRALKNV